MKQKELKSCMELFWTFFKIGAFTFGGGYAMIPLIRTEVVEKKEWLTKEDIVDIIAVAESTPGPLAINSATFVGYQAGGILGAACATVGVMIPSFFIILIISNFLRQFERFQPVAYAFWGIRIGVLSLILNAMLTMAKECKREVFSYAIIAFAFLMVAFFDISPIIVLVLCAVAGISYAAVKKKTMDGE